jgi:activator of HSP90 ATPase
LGLGGRVIVMKKTIRKVYKISSAIDQVWQALVDPAVINEWSGGPSKMDSNVGSDFELWNGEIFGKNIEVISGRKLVQEWVGGDWPKASIVTFSLKEDKKGTVLELEQINVPDDEFDDIDPGWDDYYIGPLKQMLEMKN